jgi:hypothetical protein
VLHFAVWDPGALWRKYVLHGDFSNALLSGATQKGGLQWGACFHTECRDVFLSSRDGEDGGYQAMLDLFRRAIICDDSSKVDAQISCGVLARLSHAKSFLRAHPPPPALGSRLHPPVSGEIPPRARKEYTPPPERTDGTPPPTRATTTPRGAPAALARGAQPPVRATSTLDAAAALARPVWTAGQQCRILPWQTDADCAVERADWRGPRTIPRTPSVSLKP